MKVKFNKNKKIIPMQISLEADLIKTFNITFRNIKGKEVQCETKMYKNKFGNPNEYLCITVIDYDSNEYVPVPSEFNTENSKELNRLADNYLEAMDKYLTKYLPEDNIFFMFKENISFKLQKDGSVKKKHKNEKEAETLVSEKLFLYNTIKIIDPKGVTKPSLDVIKIEDSNKESLFPCFIVKTQDIDIKEFILKNRLQAKDFVLALIPKVKSRSLVQSIQEGTLFDFCANSSNILQAKSSIESGAVLYNALFSNTMIEDTNYKENIEFLYFSIIDSSPEFFASNDPETIKDFEYTDPLNEVIFNIFNYEKVEKGVNFRVSFKYKKEITEGCILRPWENTIEVEVLLDDPTKADDSDFMAHINDTIVKIVLKLRESLLAVYNKGSKPLVNTFLYRNVFIGFDFIDEITLCSTIESILNKEEAIKKELRIFYDSATVSYPFKVSTIPVKLIKGCYNHPLLMGGDEAKETDTSFILKSDKVETSLDLVLIKKELLK